MRNSLNTSQVKVSDISMRISDNLIQYFYLFGIEPDSLDISDFTEEKHFLKRNFKNVQLLTQFPPFSQKISNLSPNIVMTHCFPNGYSLIESEQKPEDEYFHFNIDNLLDLWRENKKFYFNCIVIYEPLKSYLNIKYKNNIPELKQNDLITEENIKTMISIDRIYIPKALCFSSFVSFPHELKILMNELLNYIRSNNITIPIEKIMENVVFGIPRPLKAYFYPLCNKGKIIPGQSNDINFTLREINQYNFSSYPYQSIFKFSSSSIISIYKGLLLEFPILFFSCQKEILSNIIETFLNLLYPLEYQYPHISILPDSNSGLIEIEKCFVFGINHKLEIIEKDGMKYPAYFLENHLNILNRAFMLCDIDTGKVNVYCLESENYHVVNFEDLGIYNEINMLDPTQNVSKDIYTGRLTDISEDAKLPEKYTEKLKNKLEEIKKENKIQNESYKFNNNKKIGEDFFYYYLASIFLYYNSYLYNGKEEIQKICKDILIKKEEEIDIENLFNVSKFLYDYKNDSAFYSKFFKTKIFKHFIIKKYLNLTFDKYMFLHFDEKILEKKNKNFFSLRKIKTQFTTSSFFQSTHPYQVGSPSNFTEEELSFIKQKKDILLNKYYQKINENNNTFNYIMFPKLIYDNNFFEKEYKPCINNSKNQNLISCLKGYQAIEDNLKSDKYKDFFSIYNGDLINRYIININEIEYHNELINALYLVWIIVFCMTFYYCDEIEKHFRIEELMRLLPKVIDPDEKVIPILLITIEEYGDENMMIKIFELIRNIKYSEYACLCNKFKSNVKLNWDLKKLDVTSPKLKISYYRDPTIDDKKLSELKTVNYDIKSLKKRTFYISESNEYYFSDSEKISFDLYYICQNCKQKEIISSLVVNVESKKKSNLMICSKCKTLMKPVSHVVCGLKKEEFMIYSPIKLLELAKDIMKENGTEINMDDLRGKYNTFFWNCIMYFKFNNLSFEMLLKYKKKEISSDKIIPKKKRRAFKVLEFENQKNQNEI